jgi:hypothetical protein
VTSIVQRVKDARAARKAEKAAEHRQASQQTLVALNDKARNGTAHIYGGTVPWTEIQKRRKRGKQQKASRKVNRRR